MPKDTTVAALFELAIGAEKTAEELYRGLETKFAHHPEVANFWGQYAAEEVTHARWLERFRDSLNSEELSAPADPHTLEEARAVLGFSVEDALEQIRNLEDAYQLASELEHSETNTVFEFLVNHFSSDEKTQSFLRTQLRDHIGRLMIDLPTQFEGAAVRRTIGALE